MINHRDTIYRAVLLFTCCLKVAQVVNAVAEIKIGVLIRHRGLEEPLNKTLENLNADPTILHSTKLVAVVELVEVDNSYQTSSASKYLNTIATIIELKSNERISLQTHIARGLGNNRSSVCSNDAHHSINNILLPYSIDVNKLAATCILS